MTEKEKEIIDIYVNQNLSAKKTGELTGYSKNGVLYILHKYNIDTSNRTYDIRKFKCNDNYFENIDTANKAYILGFIAADGCILENNTLQITIKKDDIEILNFIKKELQYEGRIKIDKETYISLRVKSKKICQDLSKYFIVPRKTKILKFPTNIRPIFYKNYIRGYFDGDGSIWLDKSTNNYKIQFIGTLDVLTNIYKIFGFTEKKLRPTSDENVIFRLDFSGNNLVYKILSQLYTENTFRLERKYLRFKDLENRVLLKRVETDEPTELGV